MPGGKNRSAPLALERRIRRCRLCAENPLGAPLPHEPRPVAILSAEAKIAICGQAPGNRVNQSGVPFADPSGDRLRDWLGVSPALFYDRAQFAIVPMGFCFPGYDKNGGDLPPRRECRATWHEAVFAAMPQLELKLLIGGHAQKFHLGKSARSSVTETVAHWRDYLDAGDGGPVHLPLPHPSWRNTAWLRKNPWFEKELLPVLRKLIQERMG